MHPFITEVPGRGFDQPRHELVLQYWFFYPYNDAGNIHEGDWEHINVVVSPRANGKEPLTDVTMRHLLEQAAAPEEFVINRVEYYFHYWVFIADYMKPNLYAPRAEWEREIATLREERVGEREVWRQIRRQAYLDEAETRLNLHPIVFIGGDNRGLQQLLAKPSRLGRASHGSYPFPGLYKDVGPQATGELVSTRWDIFRDPPESTASEAHKVVRLDNPDRLEIIPTGSGCCRSCGRIRRSAARGRGSCCRSASDTRRPDLHSRESCATRRPGMPRSSRRRTMVGGTASGRLRGTIAITRTGCPRCFRPANKTITGRGGERSTSRSPPV